MRASGGVVASAVVEFLGSALMLLLGVFTTLMSFSDQYARAAVPGMHHVLFAVSGMYLAIGVGGIATGAGLLRLKNWARIVTIAFGAFLAFLGVVCVVMVPIALGQMPPQPGVDAQTAETVRRMVIIVSAVIYGSMAAIGVWWLWYFNRESVKAQFRSGVGAEGDGRRPISVSVLAVLALASVLFLPFVIVMRLPAAIMGTVVTGWAASAIYLLYLAVHVAMGVGLWKLKESARLLAIGYWVFVVVNTVVWALTPNSLEKIHAAFGPRMGVSGAHYTHLPPAFHWVGAVMGVMMSGAAIYFLVKNRAAFRAGEVVGPVV